MAGKEESMRHFTIQHEKKIIPAALHLTETGHLGVIVILTHGAGGDMDFPQHVTIARCLKDAGFSCLRFTCKGLNIVYRTKVYTTVLKYVHDHKDEFGFRGAILAGRSMGSRAAAGTANSCYTTELGSFILGVVCLAYPLHPPNDTTKLRDSLLREMNHPCLIVNGSNDGMCRQDLIRTTLSKARKQDDAVKKYAINSQKDLSGQGIEDTALITVHWLEGSDHGYKAKGRALEDVIEEVAKTVVDFCQKVRGVGVEPKSKDSPDNPKAKQKLQDINSEINIVEDGPRRKRGTKRKCVK